MSKTLAIYFTKLREGPFSVIIPAGAQVKVSGDLGIRYGEYRMVNGSGVDEDNGKWLQVWRKVNGTWRIALEMANSDQLPLFPPDPRNP